MESRHPFKSVVAVVNDGVGSFGLGIIGEIFGFDRGHRGLPSFDFAVVAEVPGPIRTDSGIAILVEHGLERLATADLILVTGWDDYSVNPSDALLSAIRSAYARGATIA